VSNKNNEGVVAINAVGMVAITTVVTAVFYKINRCTKVWQSGIKLNIKIIKSC